MKQGIGNNRNYRFLLAGILAALVLPLVDCGGGGSSGGSSSAGTTPNPVPTVASISPTTAPAGSRALTLTVNGTNFISSSMVQWAGLSRSTSYVSSTQLTASILPADLSSAGTPAVTVVNPTPGGGASSTLYFTITAITPLSISTTQLPDGSHSKAYNYTIQASGGISPYTWSIAGGSLPSGLGLSAGVISGTPPAVTSNTTSTFTVQVSDYANQPNTASHSYSLTVRALSLGRNDTCSTATPIKNGVLRASISPYGDIDVYSFQGTAGSSVTAEIYAQRLSSTNFLDSFLEILDSNCARLAYNDDISTGVVVDSLIQNYKLPYTGTYYIRVSDLSGNGRPDFIYDLHLSGAN